MSRSALSRVPIAGLAVIALALPAGCGTSTGPTDDRTAPAAGGKIIVLAAASLTEAFTQIGNDFETGHDQEVTFSFGSSSTLATQITQGAPADVFAAASPATMKTVTDAGAAATPVDFVSNTLEIAVPKGNPGKVTGLQDFADEHKKIAICAPQVPCGAAAAKVFAAARLTARPDTLEQDVKSTLQKVSSNEVDAALVYKTDVVAAGERVQGITFPESAQAVNNYPIAVVKGSANAAAAQTFVDYVRSPEGSAVLSKAGFARP